MRDILLDVAVRTAMFLVVLMASVGVLSALLFVFFFLSMVAGVA